MTLSRALLALLLFLGASIAGPAVAAVRPNFLVIVSDDQRPDTIGALGHPIVRTPHLDSLAQQGVVFRRACASYPICYVSRAEILTGSTAFRNGVGYRGNVIDPSLATWAGTLRNGGYRTCYTGKWHNNGQPAQHGYTETRGLFSSGGSRGAPLTHPRDAGGRAVTGYTGWTFKGADGVAQPDKGIGLTPETSRHIGDAAVEFLSAQHDAPFFLHVNFAAAHDPRLIPPGFAKTYDPATIPLPANFQPQHPFDHGNLKGRDEILFKFPRDPAEIRAELAVYYALISDMDAQIGRMLSALRASGELERTVVIFTSDQGMAMGGHGLMGKQNMYEHTINAPLLISGPGLPAGRRIDADCHLRDLFPTACDLAGVPVPATVEGRSLVPLLNGTAKAVHPFAVGYFTGTQRMIREGDWKVIGYPEVGRWQMFHLASDPWEQTNLVADFNSLGEYEQNVPKFSDLRHKLVRWLTANGDPSVTNLARTRPSFEPPPRASAVMVFGTSAPVAVPHLAGLTLRQALDAVKFTATKGRVTVWRADGRREPVDLAQLAAGKLEVAPLETGEMVFVPKSR
jgi:arylsulfatase A-like enzyme